MHTFCLAQFAVQLDTTYTHSWCTHCAWISCTAVHLYFSPVSVQSGTMYTTSLYNCTLASASLDHRRASIYLLRYDWSIRPPHHPDLNCGLRTHFARTKIRFEMKFGGLSSLGVGFQACSDTACFYKLHICLTSV